MGVYDVSTWVKNATILVSDVDNGGGCACVGVGVYGKSLFLPLNFIEELNML